MKLIIFPLEMDVYRLSNGCGRKQGPAFLCQPTGTHIKATLFKLGHAQATDPTPPLLDSLSLFVESVVSSAADLRGHPQALSCLKLVPQATFPPALSHYPPALTSTPLLDERALPCPPSWTQRQQGFCCCLDVRSVFKNKNLCCTFFLLQRQYLFIIKIFKQCRQAEWRNKKHPLLCPRISAGSVLEYIFQTFSSAEICLSSVAKEDHTEHPGNELAFSLGPMLGTSFHVIKYSVCFFFFNIL